MAEGAVIGIFPESERSVLGRYQGAQCQVASILARLPVPVIPIGLSGAYDVGPRWAGVLRRRRVVARIGEPVDLADGDPAGAIDRAVLGLIDEPAQRVTLGGLPRERLERAVWRCPACLDEEGWDAAELSCGSCGTRWSETADGLFAAGDREPVPFADLARPVWEATDEGPFCFHAKVSRERSLFGPILPLEPHSEGPVEVGPDGVRFGDTRIPLAAIRQVSTERGDSLQLATADELWELRVEGGSVFRLQLAVDRWRAKATCWPGSDPPRARGVARFDVASSVGGTASWLAVSQPDHGEPAGPCRPTPPCSPASCPPATAPITSTCPWTTTDPYWPRSSPNAATRPPASRPTRWWPRAWAWPGASGSGRSPGGSTPCARR